LDASRAGESMFTQNNLESIRLDEISLGEALNKQLDALEDLHQPIVYIEASLESWEKIKISLCGLRASNVPSILLLKEAPTASLEEIVEVLGFLKKLGSALCS